MATITAILGISAYYHDSAAALVVDGHVVAAIQEERFSRLKHDAAFPTQAIISCLNLGKIDLSEVDYIVFYDKPFLKFERLLETYLLHAPLGIRSFLKAMPIWLKEKLFLKTAIKHELTRLSGIPVKMLPPLLFNEHHQSHAASAFFPSPFNKSAVLCLDGVGEWATSSVWLGEGNDLKLQWEINFPHSLGLLYSAFTYYTGFKVNSGEYKLMGLAPYGEPKYVEVIRDNLIDIKDDGTFRLNMKYFNYPTGLTMTNKAFDQLFDGPPRKPESEISQKEMDIARSIQIVTEEVVLKLAEGIFSELEVENLCLAGGVALNCVANGRLAQEGPFRNLWIQPASGDAGGALGAAMSVWHEYLEKPRVSISSDLMQGSYLGPRFSNKEIKCYLDSIDAKYRELNDDVLLGNLAGILEQQNIVGWFQGRMEFGPRSLGGRSILGDPRSAKTQEEMNLKIKYRESFRPFAPAVKVDKMPEWFELQGSSPYMLLVAKIASSRCRTVSENDTELFGIDKLKVVRSEIPAVTHVDYSARVQSVHPETNPRFYALLDEFEKLTGCPVLVNTSFNVRGEPIVNTPEDAFRCFMRTEMDYLVLENIILAKVDQKPWQDSADWQQEFELD